MMHTQLERHPLVVARDDRALLPAHHTGEGRARTSGVVQLVGVGPPVPPGEGRDLDSAAEADGVPDESERGQHRVSDDEDAEDRGDRQDVAASEEPQADQHRRSEQEHGDQDHQESTMRRQPDQTLVGEDVSESRASSQRFQIDGYRLHDSEAHGPLRFSVAAALKSDQLSPNFSNDFSSTLPSLQCMTRPTV